eukprot:m.46833 g.46833  ORF g.46833 m.46833 type:complete len:385 (+) comp10414_c0_seq1:111-1265(+)
MAMNKALRKLAPSFSREHTVESQHLVLFYVGVLFVAIVGIILMFVLDENTRYENIELQKGYLFVQVKDPYGDVDGNGTGVDVHYKPPQYCADTSSSNTTTTGTARPRLPCLFWKFGNAVFPRHQSGQLSISTKVDVTNWTDSEPPGCRIQDWTNPNCEFPYTEPTSYFIPDVEKYAINITHSISGRAQGLSRLANGKLVGSDGTILKTYGHNVGDILNVTDILIAANLPQFCKIPGKCAPDEYYGLSSDRVILNGTFRELGLSLLVSVDWKNSPLSSPDTLFYTYTVSLVRGIEDQFLQIRYNDNGNKRLLYNRHSLRIQFAVNGEVQWVSFFKILTGINNSTMFIGLAGFATYMLLLSHDNKDKHAIKGKTLKENPYVGPVAI